MAVFKGVSEEVEGEVFEITETETSIGRHGSNLIVLNHLSVSAFHCCVVKDGDKYTMRDLDSTNGTRVDNQKVGVRRLASGNMVRIGGMEFLFETGVAAEMGPSPVTAKARRPSSKSPIAKGSTTAAHGGFQTSGKLRGKGVFVVLGIVGVVALIGAIAVAVIIVKMS